VHRAVQLRLRARDAVPADRGTDIRILLIARPFTFHGGVERATAGLLGALVARGHEMHLASPGAGASIAGVTVHRLRMPRLPAAARAWLLTVAARRAVAAGRWDVVQSHERTLCQQVYRAGEGCHRAYLASVGRGGRRGLHHRVVLALEARVFARTPRIVAIAGQGKREIEALYGVSPARVRVIYNGVDLERFHPANGPRHRATARAEAGLAPREHGLLFVGSGFERKGLGTAIEALPHLGDARLIVIGRGDESPYRALAARLGVDARVRWLGLRRDVERWYAAADVLVLPARYEPFGNVHLEALASGLAVVTTTAAGGSEVIEEGKNGAVVPPADPAALAGAVARLRDLDPPGLTASARGAAEPFTYVRQAEEFERLYREIP
jgi:UDP-glucose:(heptosyl)LPS alpha-1,3-glucosyltransferase